MPLNPYAPPTAEVTTPTSGHSRPIAAWLLLFALCVALLLFLFGVSRAVLLVSQHGAAAYPGSLLLAAGWRIGVVALTIFSLVSIYRGRKIGRWIGLVVIFAFAIYSLVSPDRTNYANNAERLGGEAAKLVILPALCAWWAYAFAFSAKARRHFLGSSGRVV